MLMVVDERALLRTLSAEAQSRGANPGIGKLGKVFQTAIYEPLAQRVS